jgi:hypothetical protein
MAQTTQATTVKPSASAGTACSRLSTSGPSPAAIWVTACTSSVGTQGASQSGKAMLPTPEAAPESAPTLETDQTATACKAQVARDHSASSETTANQLRK